MNIEEEAMRKSSFFTIASIFSLAVISVACSFPLLKSSSDEVVIPTLEPQVITVIVTQAPEEEEKDAPVATTAPAAVVSQKADFDGEWTIWMGDSSKGYTLHLLVQGDKISGTTVVENKNSISFIGTIQEDGTTVEGVWEKTDGTSGVFSMFISSDEDAFTGNMDSSKAFCGSRSSSLRPATCLE